MKSKPLCFHFPHMAITCICFSRSASSKFSASMHLTPPSHFWPPRLFFLIIIFNVLSTCFWSLDVFLTCHGSNRSFWPAGFFFPSELIKADLCHFDHYESCRLRTQTCLRANKRVRFDLCWKVCTVVQGTTLGPNAKRTQYLMSEWNWNKIKISPSVTVCVSYMLGLLTLVSYITSMLWQKWTDGLFGQSGCRLADAVSLSVDLCVGKLLACCGESWLQVQHFYFINSCTSSYVSFTWKTLKHYPVGFLWFELWQKKKDSFQTIVGK